MSRTTGPLLLLVLTLSCAGASPAPTPVEPPGPKADEARAEPEEPQPTSHEEPSEPAWDKLLWWYRPDPYMLDHIARDAVRDDRGRLQCPDVEVVSYRGEFVRYHRPVRVNTSFRERLRRFEEIVARVGVEVYGRAPTHIEHMGTQNCRVIKHRRYRLSEHALANAIDVAAFRFPAIARADRDLAPDGLAGAFTVDIEKHWDAVDGRQRHHAMFMKRLVIELWKDRVFRGVIVPPARGHKDHLHLDMGRWRFFRGDVTLPPDPAD